MLSVQLATSAAFAMWRAMIPATSFGSRVCATSRDKSIAALSSVAVAVCWLLVFHRKMLKMAYAMPSVDTGSRMSIGLGRLDPQGRNDDASAAYRLVTTPRTMNSATILRGAWARARTAGIVAAIVIAIPSTGSAVTAPMIATFVARAARVAIAAAGRLSDVRCSNRR